MKKVSKLSLILVAFIMIICSMGKVQAASSCNISLAASKNNNEVTVDLNLINIESGKGIIGFNGTIEYDHKVLKFERMEGQNTWKTPVEKLEYNVVAGTDNKNAEIIFLTTREGGFATANETVLKIVFTVIDTEKADTTVTVKDAEASDTTLVKVDTEAVKINLKATEPTTPDTPTTPTEPSNPDNPSTPTEPTNPDTPTTPDNPSNPTNPTTPDVPSTPTEPTNPTNPENPNTPSDTGTNNNNQGTNGTNNNKVELPKTGENNVVLPVCIGVAVCSSIIFLIKMIIANKKG